MNSVQALYLAQTDTLCYKVWIGKYTNRVEENNLIYTLAGLKKITQSM